MIDNGPRTTIMRSPLLLQLFLLNYPCYILFFSVKFRNKKHILSWLNACACHPVAVTNERVNMGFICDYGMLYTCDNGGGGGRNDSDIRRKEERWSQGQTVYPCQDFRKNVGKLSGFWP